MKKINKKVVLILSGVLIAGTLFLGGCRWHKSPEERMEWMTEHITDELDLDETQEARFKQGAERVLAKHKEMHASHQASMDSVIAQLKQDELDPAQLQAVADAHRQGMDALIPIVIEEVVAFHQTLTPEQRAELAEKLQKFKDRHHQGGPRFWH